MYKIIFDSNVYDLMNNRHDLQKRIKSLIDEKKVTVIVPNTVSRELIKSPFKGVPDWFQTEKQGDSVFILDYSLLDVDKLGNGEVYSNHKGTSLKIQDAIIAACADADANVFVSEDKRCRKRLKEISNSCTAMTFAEFETWLDRIDC